MAIYWNQAGPIELTVTNQFYNEVMEGLTTPQKFLSSKYFYDAAGDKLFQQIMASPEYYLTNCEMEIFAHQTSSIAKAMFKNSSEFDVIELGAGDATKSTHLLRFLADAGKLFTYFPVDISESVIALLENEMPERISNLEMQGLRGEYLEMVRRANTISEKRKLILFLGSNIGNFTISAAKGFLLQLQQEMSAGDLLLIGVDLKKNPKQILAAYNDAAGVTKAFNLNLLKRINRELGADFNISHFDHFPTYDPISGACKSYLFSLRKQTVTMAGSVKIEFEKDESIYMELSQKYSVPELDKLGAQAGFKPIAHFSDTKGWFLNTIWEKKREEF